MGANATVLVVYGSWFNEMNVVGLPLALDVVCWFVTMRSHEGALASFVRVDVGKKIWLTLLVFSEIVT